MIYIIGDLHLSYGVENKSMAIFGSRWENHEQKLKENWLRKIREEDYVIHAGDFSWAMKLEETLNDFKFINTLPGKKIFLKGNHDYWWTSITKNKKFLEKNKIENIEFMINNSILIEDKAFCGTKGWDTKRIDELANIRREKIRLEQSIKDMDEKLEKLAQEGKDISKIKRVCVIHYPPFDGEVLEKYIQENGHTEKEKEELRKEYSFEKVINENNIDICYYAHLHGKAHHGAFQGIKGKTRYILVSSDYLDFDPLKVEIKD